MLKASRIKSIDMRIVLFGHLGIGDHIYMNGLVHTLIQNMKGIDLEEICIIACDDYRKETLIHMYKDYPIVSFHYLPISSMPITEIPTFQALHERPSGTLVSLNNKTYILYTFGLHSPLKVANPYEVIGCNWVDFLYLAPLAINPMHRYTHFRCPSNLSVAEEKFRNLINFLGHSNYILLHDDPSRNRILDKGVLLHFLEKDNMKNLTVLYLGKDRYNYPLIEGLNNTDISTLLECDSLFDLTYILAAAKACHLMDSSIACLVDVLGISTKLYMHSYMMPNTGKSFVRPPWMRIETTQMEML